jgi:hypothetical protein
MAPTCREARAGARALLRRGSTAIDVQSGNNLKGNNLNWNNLNANNLNSWKAVI